MLTITAEAEGTRVECSYPSSWYAAHRTVPTLVVPKELFTICNYPIAVAARGNLDTKPAISRLAPDAILLWCYVQAPEDSGIGVPSPIANYSDVTLPLDYFSAKTYSAYAAHDWDGSSFLWRRLGFMSGRRAVSLLVWEGIAASEESVSAVQAIVSTIRSPATARA